MAALVTTGRAELLEENPVVGVSRWHRLSLGGIDQFRERLAPARGVTVWPGLLGDPETRPLPAAVLPDQDGVLRARWETEPG